jgi:hypothetical protein
MPRKNSTGYDHNHKPPKATHCDGCGEEIGPDDEVLYDRRLPILFPVTRDDGRMYWRERVGAFHSVLCKTMRRNILFGQSLERERDKPHP